ncbi:MULTISPECIES: hypothetical protein [Rhodococcus]|uniref:hypothetical protein n=1 Tax=Rhodococcus TaxID=1827 RepID=UPI00096AA419|nr:MULTISPECIES: hypothetical protein [unclassified Rhodococcus (in: high G+C Gram-positive bacteria)]
MYQCTRPLTHRPTRDGLPVDRAHVPAFLAIEVAGYAWDDALREASGGKLSAADVVIVNVDANFSCELLVGDAQFFVSLRRIGRTSFVLETSIAQAGSIAAVATFTVAHIADGAPSPLSSRQVEFLRTLEP